MMEAKRRSSIASMTRVGVGVGVEEGLAEGPAEAEANGWAGLAGSLGMTGEFTGREHS